MLIIIKGKSHYDDEDNSLKVALRRRSQWKDLTLPVFLAIQNKLHNEAKAQNLLH